MSALEDERREPPARGQEPRSEQERIDRARMRSVAVALTGLLAGALLARARFHLSGAFGPLVDSAGAWLTAPCVLGVLMRSRRGAAAAGLGCALLELGAWLATAALLGSVVASSQVWFWVPCTLIGGPLFGLAGSLIRRPAPEWDGLGAAIPAALFLAEGIWNDFHELHSDAPGWLWIAIGLALCLALLRSSERIRWMALTLPLAFAGEIALTQIHR